MGRYAESEEVYKRSIAIDEKVLGSEHPWLATRLGNIGNLYQKEFLDETSQRQDSE